MAGKKIKKLKKWFKRIFLVILVLIIIWVVNLIWFKPFNVEHLYNRTFIKVMLNDPELVTQLDVPILYGWTNQKLTDASDEADRQYLDLVTSEYKFLQKYDFDALSKENQLNSKILSWYLENQIEKDSFFYQDYSIDHLDADILKFPRLMEEYHKLEKKSDVEAYLKRLEKFPFKVTQIITKDSIRASKGILPPNFIIQKTIEILENLIGITNNSTQQINKIESNVFYIALKEGLSNIKGISKKDKLIYLDDAERIIESKIIPAYETYIDHLEDLLKTSTSEAGVWKLPNGDAYYRYCLRQQTTTTLDPDTIHKIGLSEVNRIQQEMREVIENNSILDSTIPMEDAMNIVALKTGKFLHSSESKNDSLLSDQLLAYYRKTLVEADSIFTPFFNSKPKSELIVKPTPEYLGSSASNQYRYTKGQGIFYTNLTNINKKDSIYLVYQKSLAYHEGIPGHHFQIAIQRELEDVPMFRNVLPFTAYTEGWGLYAEYLAKEAGAYKNDPAGDLGRLLAELHRAVRLVVDTGLHHKKWSREESIQYMMENLYVPRGGSEREIDRYVVRPGQACSYKIGMMKILELRKNAETELGDNFNIKNFHDVILKHGPLPLEVLEDIVNTYIEENKLAISGNTLNPTLN